MPQVGKLLAPSGRLLDMLRESFTSGAQQQFAERMWQKAQTDEPFKLFATVCSKAWQTFMEGPPDDSDPPKSL